MHRKAISIVVAGAARARIKRYAFAEAVNSNPPRETKSFFPKAIRASARELPTPNATRREAQALLPIASLNVPASLFPNSAATKEFVAELKKLKIFETKLKTAIAAPAPAS